MKKTKIFSLVFLPFIFTGCMLEDEPSASFTVQTDLVIEGDYVSYTDHPVTFTNTSLNADHYIWYFGDNTSGTETNPTHSYSNQGLFFVTLVAYSKSERKMDEAHYSIYVLNPLTVTFNNPVYTDIVITVEDYGTKTIPVEGSVSYYVFDENIHISAYTYDQFSNGDQLGEYISWDDDLYLPYTSNTFDLNINSTMCYFTFKNNTVNQIGPIHINYGLSDAYIIDAVIPASNGSTYGIGYHKAFSNSVVRAYNYNSPANYWEWSSIPFTWTDNQYIGLVLNAKDIVFESPVISQFYATGRELRLTGVSSIPRKTFDGTPIYSKK